MYDVANPGAPDKGFDDGYHGRVNTAVFRKDREADKAPENVPATLDTVPDQQVPQDNQ